MGGLFDTFTIGKRGLSVSQSEINTTSHNIANANTTGYTRQRSVATTTTPYGGNSKFDSLTVGQVGTGAQISSIERIRDSFLDYQVRTQTTTNSSLDTQNTYLQQVEDILNETDDTGVKSSLGDFFDAFQTLSTGSEDSSNKQVAVSDASTLANAINDRYTQLETKQSDLQEVLGTNVTEINSTLDQINTLNQQITKVTALGLTPNDLMDSRDNLLDELSTKFGIKVDSEDDNGITVTTNEMSGVGNLVDASDLSGKTDTRFSSVEGVQYDSTSSTMTITYNKLGDTTNTGTITLTGLNSTDAATLKSSLEKNRILLADSSGNVKISGVSTTTGNVTTTSISDVNAAIFAVSGGEVGGNQAVQGQVQDCMDKLDKFAAGLAYTVNAIQTGSTDASTSNANISNNVPIFVVSGTSSDSGITAKNITINSTLESDPTLLNCGETDDSGEKDGTRALAIADLASLKINLTSIGDASSLTRSTFFSQANLAFKDTSASLDLVNNSSSGATLDDNYTSMVSGLATKASEVDGDLTNSQTQLTSLTNQRTSVSGVSLDEEMTNLIEYQHAYQANAKVISTINSLLDVVINGLIS